MLRFSSTWKSLTNPGGWIFGCETIPQFPGRPYIKEAKEPHASNGIKWFHNGASGAAALWRECGRLKITDQSRGMNFWMWFHPLICQLSICKRSGQTTTKRQNRASIVLRPIGAILSMLLFFVCLKITDQSRGMNFWMWYHPSISGTSTYKRSRRATRF